MRHSIHLFIGEEMVSIAEAISCHLQKHNVKSAENYAHVACWENLNGVRTIRTIGNGGIKSSMEDDNQGAYYLADLHDRIINIAAQDSFGAELYMCIYVQLYNDSVLEEIKKIIAWTKASQKIFLIDVYGLANDVAKVFCSGKTEELALINRAESYAKNTKFITNELISLKESAEINRVLILQNCNLNGIGLGLDKNTLIKIFGEYALLATEQFNDIYPMSDFDRPDVSAFGIAALWFDKYFFTDYLLSYSYLYVMNRENVGQHFMNNPLDLLDKAKKYIGENCSFLTSFYETYIKSKTNDVANATQIKIDTCNEFKLKLNKLKEVFLSVMTDGNLSLPEKRAMLALFIREDDELFDDNVLLEELSTIDDCFMESLSLYIDEANFAEEDGEPSILTGPRNHNGKIYLPLNSLKSSKAEVRKSQSFIRKCEKRLKAIKEAEHITEISKRRLTPEGFTYGETTYHLQHDVVEKTLEKTYEPSNNSKQSVDLRGSFSPIRNQGVIGSCTAFSMTSIFEFLLNQADTSCKHKLSPRFLYYNVCSKNDDGTPIDNGSSLYDNIESLGRDGVCVEGLCPYEEGLKAPSEEAVENAASHLVTEAKNVELNHQAITSALSDGYPIAISLKIFNSFDPNSNGFIFRPTENELNGTDYGYHAMVICGYSEAQKIYIVRNSWGEKFGDKGYCYIPFSYIEDSSLCRQACIITGVNCQEYVTKCITDEIINFDEDSYAIEYAITRILMEEEQQNLIVLESKYNSLYGEYIKLVHELTNRNKRDALTKHAVNKIESQAIPNSPKKRIVSKPRFGNEKIFIPAIFLILAILAHFAGSNTAAIITLFIAVAIGIWMFCAKKHETIEETVHDTNHINSNAKLSQELKFICAGQAIDVMANFRDELEKKHRYLTSYIGHFCMWLNDEEKKLRSFDDKLRPPFNAILTMQDFEKIFNLKKELFTNDIWLWKEFETYMPTEEKAREFQNRIKNKLHKKIEVLHTDFSMAKFMMNSENFDYLFSSDMKREQWLSNIESQSVPFVQCSGIQPNTKKIIFIKALDSPEKNAWENYIINNCTSQPTCAFGGSPYKLTFVQIQPLRKENVKFLQS